MKRTYLFFWGLLSMLLWVSWVSANTNWLFQKHKGYTIRYTTADQPNLKAYQQLVKQGISNAKSFFHTSYKQDFEVVIHPSRQSLDSTWQKDWNMPEFRSECWMVASGIASKLDMISPKLWDIAACEHHYSDKAKTAQLIAHELIHVYHGQVNASPDFSNVEGIDWFVEGLATYASGQCDSVRISEVKKAINEHKIPTSLDNFWTGKLKYGLSGSMVQFIDHQYGRAN